MRVRKEKTKPSLFVVDVIICLENPRSFTNEF